MDCPDKTNEVPFFLGFNYVNLIEMQIVLVPQYFIWYKTLMLKHCALLLVVNPLLFG